MAKKRTVSKSRSATTKTASRVDTLFVLQIVVAVFLVAIGLSVLIYADTGWTRLGRDVHHWFGRTNDPFNVIVAVVELLAGVLLFAALFVPVKTRWLYWTTLVIAIVWAIWIFLDLFVNRIFEPTFFSWLKWLAADFIQLLALWLINRKYA
jgi:hypothetical protein